VQGYIQVYTGDGKGKTTAAIGLAVRALGAGLKVYLAQFLKFEASSEITTLQILASERLSAPAGFSGMYPHITIEQFGKPRKISPFFDEEDKRLVQQGWEKARQHILEKSFDLIILDEIHIALHYKLIKLDELLTLLSQKPPAIELILTGRYAPPEVMAAADLVTEMKCIKHYFEQGVRARLGIEK
jgi:cob(I)alamin adenosyltransferase